MPTYSHWHLPLTETRKEPVYHSKWYTDRPAIAVCSALQSAATHCPNRLVTRSLQLDRPTYGLASLIMSFTMLCSSSPTTTHYFSGEYYQVLTATHLPTWQSCPVHLFGLWDHSALWQWLVNWRYKNIFTYLLTYHRGIGRLIWPENRKCK